MENKADNITEQTNSSNDGFSPESISTTPTKKGPSELQKRKIGALWVDTSKNGHKYMSGSLELDGKNGKKIKIVVFKNINKRQENLPDYEIFLSDKAVAKDILD